jgi:hypothetical protein
MIKYSTLCPKQALRRHLSWWQRTSVLFYETRLTEGRLLRRFLGYISIERVWISINLNSWKKVSEEITTDQGLIRTKRCETVILTWTTTVPWSTVHSSLSQRAQLLKQRSEHSLSYGFELRTLWDLPSCPWLRRKCVSFVEICIYTEESSVRLTSGFADCSLTQLTALHMHRNIIPVIRNLTFPSLFPLISPVANMYFSLYLCIKLYWT